MRFSQVLTRVTIASEAPKEDPLSSECIKCSVFLRNHHVKHMVDGAPAKSDVPNEVR